MVEGKYSSYPAGLQRRRIPGNIRGWGTNIQTSARQQEFMVGIPQNLETASNRAFCNYCPGFCCYRLPGSILFVTATDINRIARHFQLSDGEVRKRFIEKRNTFKVKDDGSCIFLHDGKLNKRCSIHMARPQQCQDFPYDEPCPYLGREDLLETIYPLMEKSLGYLLS